jgi:ATP-dependent Clp protease ATP-binding subunit ClpC
LTTDKDFKRLVRARARKTGESYALARRLLSKAGGTPVPPNPGELEEILVLAQDQARILGHSFIGTEHLLLGLIVEEQGLAGGVLAAFDVTLEPVRSKIKEIVEFAGPSTGGSLPQTPRTQKVIHYAREAVVDLGHMFVCSGHLLLGLIREDEGVGVRVLNDLGVDSRRLRAATLRAMGVSAT